MEHCHRTDSVGWRIAEPWKDRVCCAMGAVMICGYCGAVNVLGVMICGYYGVKWCLAVSCWLLYVVLLCDVAHIRYGILLFLQCQVVLDDVWLMIICGVKLYLWRAVICGFVMFWLLGGDVRRYSWWRRVYERLSGVDAMTFNWICVPCCYVSYRSCAVFCMPSLYRA